MWSSGALFPFSSQFGSVFALRKLKNLIWRTRLSIIALSARLLSRHMGTRPKVKKKCMKAKSEYISASCIRQKPYLKRRIIMKSAFLYNKEGSESVCTFEHKTHERSSPSLWRYCSLSPCTVLMISSPVRREEWSFSACSPLKSPE